MILTLMAIFLYGKHINWRKLKETLPYEIKSIVAIILATILGNMLEYSRNFLLSNEVDTIEIILVILIGVFWYREYKKINKRSPFPQNYFAGNLKKNEILKVTPENGFWTCPSCNDKNWGIQDVCSNCGQEVEKSNS